MFKVSVKGVVTVNGRLLLRVNERDDYELLGGKLERTDRSLASRVRQELLEESGVAVEPTEDLEPWFYVFGDQAVLIVPMSCDVLDVPETLFDQDGGRLEWVDARQLDTIRLPRSYLASIRGERLVLMRLSGNPGLPTPMTCFVSSWWYATTAARTPTRLTMPAICPSASAHSAGQRRAS